MSRWSFEVLKYYLLDVATVVGQTVLNDVDDDITDLDEISTAERYRVYGVDDRLSTAGADFLQGVGNPIVISNVAWEVMQLCGLAENLSLPVEVVNDSGIVQRTDTQFVLFKESYEIADEVNLDAYHNQRTSVFMAGKERPPIVSGELLPSFDLFRAFGLSCVCTERFKKVVLEHFLIGVKFHEVKVV